MATETVSVTPEARRALLSHAADSRESLVKLASEALVRGLTADPSPSPERPPMELDRAADAFLCALPTAFRDLILDLCREEHRSPAQYLLSYCHLAYERGEVNVLLDESTWNDAVGSVPGTPLEAPKCEHCGAEITGARRGQRYCFDRVDDPGASCGRQASLVAIQAKRRRVASDTMREAMRSTLG